tara:strand:- start:3581 stop:5953 length:2373 start_codon:yes stop_codon:yes gene_type:complete
MKVYFKFILQQIMLSMILFSSIIANQPMITIISPVDNTVTTKQKVLIKGTAKNTKVLTLNNKTIPLNKNGQFYVKEDLKNINRYNYFILTATSPSGEIVKLARKVFYKVESKSETKKPLIKLTSPQNNLITTSPDIMFSGKLSGSNKLTISGVTVNVTQEGYFNFPYKLTKINDYETFYIISTSNDGKSKTSISRNIFYRDKNLEGLSIMLTNPNNNFISSDAVITFTGVLTGAKAFKINNKDVPFSENGRFSYTTSLKKVNDYNDFNLVATNSNNKKVSIKRTIFLKSDKTIQLSQSETSSEINYQIPEIIIQNPENNFVTYKNLITVTGKTKHAKELFINNRIVKLDARGGFSEVFELETFGKYLFNIYAIGDNGLNTTSLLKIFRINETKKTPITQAKPNKKILNKKLQKLVSLNLAGADLRDVISILAQKGDLNLVTDKSLQGEIYITLQDVKIIDALDFVLNSQGISYKIIDSTIMIGGKAALDQPSRLETKIIRLNNIKSTVIKPILEEYLVAGEVIQTQESLVILTADTKKIEKLTSIIQKLDSEKIPQIILEAQILEITKSVLDNLGVVWSDTYGIGLDITETAGELAYQSTISGISAVINLLENDGKAKVLAKPKIKAIHGQEATIFIGDRIPYTELTISGGSVAESIKYANAGINLSILPEINAFTQEIKIKIIPEVSYINGYRGKNNDIPVLRTRKVDTTVYVKNRNTVLIGGLFNSSDSDTESRFPFISQLPFFGVLFKSQKSQTDQTELVIAITPQIIDDTFEESIPIPISNKKLIN